MYTRIVKVSLSLGLFSLLIVAAAKGFAKQSATNPQQVLAEVMQWWPGDYNNDRQVAELIAAGKPIWKADDSGKGGHIEVESHYRTVQLPEIGEHVLYVEEFKHGDQSNIFRQRIYSLAIDEEAGQVKVKLWYFNDKKKYVGAWKDTSLLADLKKDELFPLQDSCDLIVSQQGDKYHMPMTDRACVFGERYFNYQVLIGKDSFWFKDKINLLADDSLVSTAGDFSYHELDRYNVDSE